MKLLKSFFYVKIRIHPYTYMYYIHIIKVKSSEIFDSETQNYQVSPSTIINDSNLLFFSDSWSKYEFVCKKYAWSGHQIEQYVHFSIIIILDLG